MSTTHDRPAHGGYPPAAHPVHDVAETLAGGGEDGTASAERLQLELAPFFPAELEDIHRARSVVKDTAERAAKYNAAGRSSMPIGIDEATDLLLWATWGLTPRT